MSELSLEPAPTQVLDTPVYGPTRINHPRSSLWLLFLFGFAIPVLALLPLLVGSIVENWQSIASRFAPFSMLVGCLFFAACPIRIATAFRLKLSILIMVAGIAIALWGLYLISNSRAQLAFALITLGWALGTFGTTSWTRLMAIWLLFAITIPLPLGLGIRGDQWAKIYSGFAAGQFLESVGIPNITEYGAMRIVGMQINLLDFLTHAGGPMALLASYLAWSLFWRRTFLISSLTCLTCFAWAFFGLILRILAFVFLHQSKLEAGSSSLSILLDCLVFLFLFVCVLATEAIVSVLFEPLIGASQTGRLIQAYQSIVSWPKYVDPRRETRAKPENASSLTGLGASVERRQSWRRLSAGWWLVLPGIACGLLGILCWWEKVIAPPKQIDQMNQATADLLPAADGLQKRIGNLRLQDYKSETRAEGSLFGKYSHVWQFEGPDTQFLISLDFPFSGTANIVDLYKLLGWEADGVQLAPIDWDQGPLVENLRLRNRYDTSAYAWVAYFDRRGNAVTQTNAKQSATRRTLLDSLKHRETVSNEYFRIRLFFETGRQISEADLKQNGELFRIIFEEIRSQVQLASETK
jgi:hypothetical protein